MTLSNGTTEFAKTTYGFDTLGRFASVGNGSHDVAYNYNDKNQLVSKILGENYQVGYSYDEFGRLVNIGGVSYTYDALNRRISMTQNSDTINYRYNDRSELIGATNNTNYNYSYSFDPIGNRTNASLASESLSYSTNLLNQYTSITSTVSTTPTYDVDGNMLNNDGWSYTWNGENRLVRAENATIKLEFDYDYMGRRIYKKVYENNILTKHIKFIYDGYKLIAEFDALSNDNLIANYTWQVNPQDVPVMATINGTTALYIPDGNKNIVKLLSLNGEVLAEYRYSPFGKVVSSSGILAEANPFRFSSEYHDDETNLVYYNYRYYSPSLGRWLSRDPIEEQGGYNLYGMCKNNIINIFDNLGRRFGFLLALIPLSRCLKNVEEKHTACLNLCPRLPCPDDIETCIKACTTEAMISSTMCATQFVIKGLGSLVLGDLLEKGLIKYLTPKGNKIFD